MEKVTTPFPAVTVPKAKPISASETPIAVAARGGPACSGCFIPPAKQITPEKELPSRLKPISRTNQPLYSTNPLEGVISQDNYLVTDKNILSNTGPGSVLMVDKKVNSGISNAPLNTETIKNDPYHKIDQLDKNSLVADKNLLSNIKSKSVPNINYKINLEKTKGQLQGNNNLNKNNPAENHSKQKNVLKKMTVTDLMGILYKFNYTLSFHGHDEIGNRAGEKTGSYFFNGRDGYGRNVKYIANEFGYQPNITLVDLDIDETPREETEKLLTKLLGNEFIWYY